MSASILARIMRKVRINELTDCWEWIGATHGAQECYYGKMSWQGRTVSAHKMTFEIAYGPAPEGMLVRHECDNPLCCNPMHLSFGTSQDNSDDMVKRGRALFGDKNPSRIKPERLQRGDSHHARRLSRSKAEDIRRRYQEPGTSLEILAGEFGVHLGTIWQVVNRKTWR